MLYLPNEEITREAVRDADCLVVRTRTKCDTVLLFGSKVRMIATATIGTDHINLDYCKANGIHVANCAGCNAPAVAQYVFASLLSLSNRPLSQYTLGIVGVGNVGKIVERWARQLDMRVLLNDPPRQASEGGTQWSSLEDIAREADIVTFHTPLDSTTIHLADTAFFQSLKRTPILINAARGPVVDNAALVEALKTGQVQHAVIDCWEGEPNINPELLRMAAIATPHIAGYSYEGKVRATSMVLDAICKYYGFPAIEMEQKVVSGAAPAVNAPAIIRSYDPLADTAVLKASPSTFEAQRNHYRLRPEVPSSKID